jgi:hypothetical protein
MQRKEPLENKGVAGMDALAAKNILTRRANHWHIFIIPKFGKLPAALRNNAGEGPLRIARLQNPNDRPSRGHTRQWPCLPALVSSGALVTPHLYSFE